MFDISTLPIPQNAFIILPADQMAQIVDAIFCHRLKEKYDAELQNKELSKSETAELLRVSEGTVDNWSGQGILRKYHRGRLTYFLYSEVITSKTSLKKYSRKPSAAT